MPDDFDLDAFEADLKETLKTNGDILRGKYAKQINQLLGLSRVEIDAITPGTTDLKKYDELIVVVKEATRVNLAQAELKRQIEKLGSVAVKIAKKVPTLAAILA